MSRYAIVLAIAMLWLAEGQHSRLPAEAIVEQAQHAIDAAHIYRLDSLLLVAVAWEESRFDGRVVSRVGACGAMQVNPRYAPWRCPEMLDSREAYEAGAWVLSRWSVYCISDDPLTCYNGGEEPGRASRQYSARVHRTVRLLRKMIDRSLVTMEDR